MRRTVVALLAVLAVLLSGCMAEPDGNPSSAQPTVVAPVSGDLNQWVQDLWVFESIATVSSSGDLVDLTDLILEELTSPDQSVALPGGAVFDVFESLAPRLTTLGTTRTDVDVVAGVMSSGAARELAVVATPHTTAERPIGIDDNVEVDLTFLGELLTPGDPILADIAMMQALPGNGEIESMGLELFAERVAAGRAQHVGFEGEDGLETGSFSAVLGVAVAGSTLMSVPGKQDAPAPDPSNALGELTCRKGGLNCVKDYFDEMESVVKDVDEYLRCNMGGCQDPPSDPEPICIGLSCPPPNLRSDPHLTSFDGQRLSMQGVGEYLLTRTEGFEVQIRTAPVRSESVVSMAAVQLGADHFVIAPNRETRSFTIWGNGERLDYDPIESLRLTAQVGDVEVLRGPSRALLKASDGSGVYVYQPTSSYFDVSIKLPDGAVTTGLLGDNDGDPDNDWAARDGSLLSPDTTGRELYTGFSDTWRLSDEESLLRYEAGETTATFTDLSRPAQVLTFDDFDPLDVARAEILCIAAGVPEGHLLEECVFDYAVTGDIAFVQSAVHAAENAMLAKSLASSEAGEGGEFDEEAIVRSWKTFGSAVPLTDNRYTHICTPNGSMENVFGGSDGVYTGDSSACVAAVHAGLITFERGGQIEITKLPRQPSYVGTTQNGVDARDWDGWWTSSFTVSLAE